jgi:glycosyltransferase involved in cell wall biosynthesis
MAEKVTILMPVHNGAHHIKEAIESVLAQTYRDFIFLIIDDASTDGSVELIKNYSDKRIRLIQNDKNIGQTETLNKGLKIACGEYIARLDQDDICFPERIEEQAAFLDANLDVAVIGSWAQVIDEKSNPFGRMENIISSSGHYLFELLRKHGTIAHPSVMLRKKVIDTLGGYDAQFPLAEDFDLWVRTVQAGHNIRILEKPLIYYRRHSSQQTTQGLDIQKKSAREAHKRFIETYLDGFPSEPVIHFFQHKEKFWGNASYSGMIHFVSSLNRILGNIKSRMDLETSDHKELKHRISALAAKNIYYAISNNHRLPSLPVFFISLRYKPVTIFSRDTLRYALFFVMLLPFVRKIKRTKA